jgi:hypothetical protein
MFFRVPKQGLGRRICKFAISVDIQRFCVLVIAPKAALRLLSKKALITPRELGIAKSNVFGRSIRDWVDLA